MSTLAVTRSRLGGNTLTLEDGTVIQDGDSNTGIKCVWDAMTTTGDVGDAVGFGQFADRTVQVAGSGFGTVVIEGSLNGVNFHTLNDATGNALSFTSGNLKSVLEFTGLIRPRASSASGAALVVTLECRKSR